MGNQAATNYVALAAGKEATYGTKAPTGNFRSLRFLNAKFSVTPKTIASQEIVSDRNISDLIQVGRTVAGSFDVELSYDTFDAMFEAALFSAITKSSEVATTAAAAGTGVYTVATGGTIFGVGALVELTGFANAANNSYKADGTAKAHKVTASIATSVTTDNTGSVSETGVSGAFIKYCGFEVASGDLALALNGAGQATLTVTTASWPIGQMNENQWIYLGGDLASQQPGGAQGPAHCGWLRIAKGGLTAKVITCDIKPAGFTGAGLTMTGVTPRLYFGDFVKNGVTTSSYSFERSFTDIGAYETFVGMLCGSLAFDFQAGAIAKASFAWQGADGTPSGTRYAATPKAAFTATPFNLSTNVGALVEGGASIPVAGPNYVLGCQITINNNLRELPALNQASGIVGINAGACEVTGTLRTYFGDLTLYNKLYNATATQYAVALRDPTGGSIVIDMPQVKFTGGAPDVSGINAEVPLELPFQALKHPTFGYTIGLSLTPLAGK